MFVLCVGEKGDPFANVPPIARLRHSFLRQSLRFSCSRGLARGEENVNNRPLVESHVHSLFLLPRSGRRYVCVVGGTVFRRARDPIGDNTTHTRREKQHTHTTSPASFLVPRRRFILVGVYLWLLPTRTLLADVLSSGFSLVRVYLPGVFRELASLRQDPQGLPQAPRVQLQVPQVQPQGAPEGRREDEVKVNEFPISLKRSQKPNSFFRARIKDSVAKGDLVSFETKSSNCSADRFHIEHEKLAPSFQPSSDGGFSVLSKKKNACQPNFNSFRYFKGIARLHYPQTPCSLFLSLLFQSLLPVRRISNGSPSSTSFWFLLIRTLSTSEEV